MARSYAPVHGDNRVNPWMEWNLVLESSRLGHKAHSGAPAHAHVHAQPLEPETHEGLPFPMETNELSSIVEARQLRMSSKFSFPVFKCIERIVEFVG